MEFSTYTELEDAFKARQLHPMDLKQAVAEEINTLLEPVRKHFEKGKPKELLEKIRGFEITR